MIRLRNSSNILIIAAFLLIAGCSITRMQKRGYIDSDSFHYQGNFTTIKSVIVLPVEINGVVKNFLFDTGADVTLVQRDTIKGSTAKVGGATNRNMKLGKEIIGSIKIGDINFVDTYGMNGDFVGLKEQVPDFGGIIGQPIISKANWLIDYPNKRLEISSKHLIDSKYTVLKIKKENGKPYINLTIDGSDYKVLIDLGSSSAFTIPEGSKLAEKLLQKNDFMENEREVYTIGGLQKTKEKTGNIATVLLDGVEFRNVDATIRYTSQLRIGNDFFKEHILYIDNLHSNYSIKRNE
jgi:predicted aspartyl protease